MQNPFNKEWQEFEITGNVSSYLKYKENEIVFYNKDDEKEDKDDKNQKKQTERERLTITC
ncbi:MAG: hypothetical protein RSB38_07145 [Oscillospiraceae bacterium]